MGDLKLFENKRTNCPRIQRRYQNGIWYTKVYSTNEKKKADKYKWYQSTKQIMCQDFRRG